MREAPKEWNAAQPSSGNAKLPARCASIRLWRSARADASKFRGERTRPACGVPRPRGTPSALEDFHGVGTFERLIRPAREQAGTREARVLPGFTEHFDALGGAQPLLRRSVEEMNSFALNLIFRHGDQVVG